jgi:RNA methyltransferase, TrmH family
VHASLQRVRRLSGRRRRRSEERAYVVDGPTLLGEALDAGVRLDEIVAEPGAPRALLDRAAQTGAAIHHVPAGSLARATDTVTPQPVAAVARFDELDLDTAVAELGGRPLVLVLVALGDPGNAGTLLRTADATGVDLVVLCDDAVDPYNPKCVRAAAGALFRLRVVRSADGAATLAALAGRGLSCLGTAVDDPAAAYDAVDLTRPTAVVLGSEAHGLPAELAARADTLVRIPMVGRTESLNVAMAGTVICFEALRQRRNLLDGTTMEAPGCSAA